jgi:predicted lipid-binding transport protein (Tim44 family)
MSSGKQHSGPHAAQAKASRRQAQQAREKLAAGGLSHEERRRLRAVIAVTDNAARRHRLEFRHISIAVGGALVVMLIVAASTGLISAIQAAGGEGVAGTFIVQQQTCAGRVICNWMGTFRYRDGAEVRNLAYGGVLPAAVTPGSSIPAREPAGSHYVYPLHGSRKWLSDVGLMLLCGIPVGVLLLISPLGLGKRDVARAGVV